MKKVLLGMAFLYLLELSLAAYVDYRFINRINTCHDNQDGNLATCYYRTPVSMHERYVRRFLAYGLPIPCIFAKKELKFLFCTPNKAK